MAEQPVQRFYWPEKVIDWPEKVIDWPKKVIDWPKKVIDWPEPAYCVMRLAQLHKLQRFRLEWPFCLFSILWFFVKMIH